MKPLKIAVTGLNVADYPQPGLSVGRCLLAARPRPQALIGLTYDLHWTAAHSRNVFRSVYLVPPPWLDETTFVERILATCREAGVRVLVPSLDADVAALARHRTEMARAGVRTFGPTPDMLARLWGFWRPGPVHRMNLVVPRSAVASDPAEIPAAAAAVGYPLVMRSPSGETAAITSPVEAQVLGWRFLRWWGGPLVLRAQIDGEEYEVAAISLRGSVAGAVAVKILTRGGNGSTWAVVTVGDEDLLSSTQEIIRRLNWTGPLLLKFFKESWSRRLWLGGTSPCFPVWVGAARGVGQNLPARALRAAITGRLVSSRRLSSYETGVMLALTSRDEISDVSALATLSTTGKLALNGHGAAQQRATKASAWRVAVTGLEAMDNPSAGLGVVRSLREAPSVVRRVNGLTFNALNTGVYAEDLFDEVHIIPAPSEPADVLFSRLREIVRRTPIDVIVPTLDTEIATYARLRPRLAQIGVRVLVPPEERVKERSKIALPMLCEQLRIPYPETFVLTDRKQLDHYLSKVQFPCVLKGAVADAHIVASRDEAEVSYSRLVAAWGLPVLLQRFLDGDEYDVTALADHRSDLIGAVAMRKTAITPKGKAAVGVTVWDDELLRLVERVVQRLRWVGPLEVEFVKESGTGRYHIFEINARFPAWIYLTTGAGQNFPLAAVRLAMGEPVRKFPPYRSGVLFVRNMREHLCTIAHLGQLTTAGEAHFNA